MLAFSGAKRSPSQAPRGAQRHPVREDGQSEQVEGEVRHQHHCCYRYRYHHHYLYHQVEGEVQHQHDSLAEESGLGQVKVCKLEGKHSHTGTNKFSFSQRKIVVNFFLEGNLDPHGKHTKPGRPIHLPSTCA